MNKTNHCYDMWLVQQRYISQCTFVEQKGSLLWYMIYLYYSDKAFCSLVNVSFLDQATCCTPLIFGGHRFYETWSLPSGCKWPPKLPADPSRGGSSLPTVFQGLWLPSCDPSSPRLTDSVCPQSHAPVLRNGLLRAWYPDTCKSSTIYYTLWLFSIAMENHHFY